MSIFFGIAALLVISAIIYFFVVVKKEDKPTNKNLRTGSNPPPDKDRPDKP